MWTKEFPSLVTDYRASIESRSVILLGSVALADVVCVVQSSVIGVELMVAFRACVEDRGTFISTTGLSLSKQHLRIVALRALLVRGLLCIGNVLRDRERGESVALAL